MKKIKFLAASMAWLLLNCGNSKSLSDQEVLAQSTQQILTTGSDERVLLGQEGVNKYFTNPRPTTMITRSSCTASFPSNEGFLAAQTTHKLLNYANAVGVLDTTFTSLMNQVRAMVGEQAGVASDVLLITAPSGTTTEMFFSLMGLLHQRRKGKHRPILNIVTASEETGSGSAASAAGKHFSTLVPAGAQVRNNSEILGFNNQQINLVEIPLRDNKTGAIKPQEDIEAQLEALLQDAIEGNNTTAILHLMHASKTGCATPSFGFAKRMKERFKNNLLVVVDAAQNRGVDGFIRQYLDAEFCVFTTGSKFYQGVPFSGCIFIPTSQATDLTNITATDIPEGLGLYLTRDDVDERLPQLRNALPYRKNFCLLLGWHTSLVNAQAYKNIPEARRNALVAQWVQHVQNLVKSSPYLSLLDASSDQSTHKATAEDLAGNSNTIIAVRLHARNADGSVGKALNTNQLRTVYKLMTMDIAKQLPSAASDAERRVATQAFLIGQPVQLTSDLGIVRIALGSTIVCRMAESNEELDNDKLIVAKLSLIAKYFDVLTA